MDNSKDILDLRLKPDVHVINMRDDNNHHRIHIDKDRRKDFTRPLLLRSDTIHKPPLAVPETDEKYDTDNSLEDGGGVGGGGGVIGGPQPGEKLNGSDQDGYDSGKDTVDLEERMGDGQGDGFDDIDGGNVGAIDDDSRPGSPSIKPTYMEMEAAADMNTYQYRKNLAQGMMDLALFTANVNQLRLVWESFALHPYFVLSLTLISLSIALQVAVGVGLIMNSRYNVSNVNQQQKAHKSNNLNVLGIFLITIVNVFITSFSVAAPVLAVPAPVRARMLNASS